jgi:hypothetical protein
VKRGTEKLEQAHKRVAIELMTGLFLGRVEKPLLKKVIL